MTQNPILVWFRQDLRLSDNPAWHAACAEKRPVIPVYIVDDKNAGAWAMGASSHWWLHQSLERLNDSLSDALTLRQGDAGKILPQLIKETGADTVYWNRCYEPWQTKRDTAIKADLQGRDIKVESFNANLLFEPWTVLKGDGTPYKVFTPFYRACMVRDEPAAPLPKPKKPIFGDRPPSAETLDALNLLPKKIRWDKKFLKHWQPGEVGAKTRLADFVDEDVTAYKEGRDRPDRSGVSRLSPHMHFGEISPRQIWHTVGDKSEAFLRQLIWREFSTSLLYHNPDMPEKPLQNKFGSLPWQKNAAHLKRWQRGLTGYPIVDAGMRQLWETGWMHNRVRMVVASFLIKDLLIDWREGEDWFWDTLVDANLANNSASWQWVAGCGADAAPFYRIFNPATQGQKFDPDGKYVREWVPELTRMPTKYIHNPEEAPADIWEKAGILRGKDYPEPIVDHKKARLRALEALAWLKENP